MKGIDGQARMARSHAHSNTRGRFGGSGFTHAAVIVGLLNCCLAAASTPALTGVRIHQVFEGPGAASGSATIGWSFQTTRAIRVTDLGFFDDGENGLIMPHRVGLWDETGRLWRDGMVPHGTSATLLDSYRHVPVKPLVLPADRTFVLGATVPIKNIGPGATIDWYPFFRNTAIEDVRIDPAFLLRAAARQTLDPDPTVDPLFGRPPPGVLFFPQPTPWPGNFFAANLLFDDLTGLGSDVATVVPEPGFLPLGISSLWALGRRKKGRRC